MQSSGGVPNRIGGATNFLKALQNAENVKVRVGSFRGTKVTVNADGIKLKMSLDEFRKSVKNALQQAPDLETEAFDKTIAKVDTDAAKTPKAKALLNKVKDAFKSFKEKVSEKANDIHQSVSSTKASAGLAIKYAPDRLREAKHKSDVNRHLYHFAVNTANTELVAENGPSTASLKSLAGQLLFTPDVKISDLKRMQVILEGNRDPELASTKALINKKIDLMEGFAHTIKKGGGAYDAFKQEYENTRLGSVNMANDSLTRGMPVPLNTLRACSDEIKLFLSFYPNDGKYTVMLEQINAEIEKLETPPPPKPLPSTPQPTTNATPPRPRAESAPASPNVAPARPRTVTAPAALASTEDLSKVGTRLDNALKDANNLIGKLGTRLTQLQEEVNELRTQTHPESGNPNLEAAKKTLEAKEQLLLNVRRDFNNLQYHIDQCNSNKERINGLFSGAEHNTPLFKNALQGSKDLEDQIGFVQSRLTSYDIA